MKVIVRAEESDLSHLDGFFENPPNDPHSLERSKKAVAQQKYDRKKLADVLRTYQQMLGEDEEASRNIDRLSQGGSFCVVTGQQLSFMGGPLYTIFKGISTVLLAKSIGAIPIFWLATEDHDITEIDHADVLDSHGNLKRFHLQFPKRRYFVEDLVFTEKNLETFHAFAKEMEIENIFSFALSIAPGDSYAVSMAKVLKYIFRGTGMLFIESRFLRPLAKEFFLREIVSCQEIQELLKKTLKTLEQNHISPAIKLSGSTNLFYKREDGMRCKVDLTSSSEKEWIERIEQAPETMSVNVVARPVLQNLLFPTVAYLAGPTEMTYHTLLKEYHHFHGIAMPWIYPRISATLIPPIGEQFLHQCQIEPWDPLPQHVDPNGSIPTYALHFLHQLLHPKRKKQERVLNWWWFHKERKNLLQQILDCVHWEQRGHHYLWI